MKRQLRNFYFWLYELIKGHLPLGTLIRFQPPPDHNGNYWMAPSDPPLHSLGIVIGGWRAFKNPGYTQSGSVVMIGSQTYNVVDFAIERVDESG